MTSIVTLKNPIDLIAVVPHVFGFTPVDSLAVISVGDGMCGRIDHPHTSENLLEACMVLGSAYRKNGSKPVFLISFTDDATHAEDALTCVGAMIADVCPVIARIHVTSTGEWFDHVTETSGTVTGADHDRIAAETAYAGTPAPLPSREDLAKSLTGDPAPVAALLDAARIGATKTEAAWLRNRIGEFLATGDRLSDADAAHVLAAVANIEFQYVAVQMLTKANAQRMVDLFRDLTRRAPDRVRPAAALLLGVAAWMQGHGALAWVAYDEAGDAGHPLAKVISHVLSDAVRPTDDALAAVLVAA